jgi:undecaprenyl-diphosphatase
MNNKYKEYIKYTILILCSVIFAIFTYKVVADKTIYIDSIVYNYISNNIINKNRTEIVKVITNITSPIMVIITLLILVLAIKDKKIKISLVINLLGITIINNLIKVIIDRPRPEINKLVTETGYSFPSGHSITSMVFYGYLVYLTYKYINNKKIKIPLIIFLILLIPTIGLSRIYLGVHYTSDVLCGFLLGIIYLILFISISKKYLERK